MNYDITIIGSGMSGLMASIHLASHGVKTAVVSKGDPICSISSGCIDIAGTERSTIKAIKSLPAGHPYHKVGLEDIFNSIQYFKDLMKEYQYEYIGEIEKNRSILTPIGKKRVTALVPFTMNHAELDNDEGFHIISFNNMKDFFPGYLTGDLNGNSRNAEVSVFDAGAYTTLGIAAKMDEEEFLASFVKWILNQNISKGKIGIPAVLGIAKTSAVYEKLELETGKKIFEIPTLPPSIPGLRLYRKLKKIASDRGVDFYPTAEISDFGHTGNKITGLIINKPGRPDKVEADAFILASGSFVSGGLYSEHNVFKETVFNTAVYSPMDKELFNKDFFQVGHPIEKAGILIDDNFHPVDSVYENLFAAGSILAYSETMKYGCGHGMAIATGIGAAKSALRYIK